MKVMKKLMALVMAIAMVLSLAITASADTTTPTVTISNAGAGRTYTFYRMLSINDSGDYEKTALWTDAVTTAVGDTVKFDESGKVTSAKRITSDTDSTTVTSSTDAQQFISKIMGVVGQLTLTDEQEKCVTTVTMEDTDTSGSKATGITTKGYYIMVSSAADSTDKLYTAFTLNEEDVPIKDKGTQTPQLTKKVAEGDQTSQASTNNEVWKDELSVDIGDTLTFRIIIKPEAGRNTYVLEDAMPTGMDVPSAENVKVYKVTAGADNSEVKTEVPSSENNVTNWTYANGVTVGATGSSSGKGFTISFSQTMRDNMKESERYFIEYTVKLTSDATAGHDSPMKNTARLLESTTEVGGSANVTAAEDSTNVRTYEVRVQKTDGTKGLAEAQFNVKKVVEDTTYWLTVSNGTTDTASADGTTISLTRYAVTGWSTSKPETPIITTPESGYFVIVGLGNGDVTLVEETTPNGYTGAGETTITINGQNSLGNKIVNTKGTKLPETGGMGTTLFYMGGGVLVVGALAVLAMKKKSAQ